MALTHLADRTAVQHTCCDQCSSIYPRQSCGSVCGIAVIIGISLAALNRPAFHALCKGIKATDNQNLPNLDYLSLIDRVSYLSDISKFAKFLRLVVMQWIAAGHINIYQIMRSCNQYLDMTCQWECR